MTIGAPVEMSVLVPTFATATGAKLVEILGENVGLRDGVLVPVAAGMILGLKLGLLLGTRLGDKDGALLIVATGVRLGVKLVEIDGENVGL